MQAERYARLRALYDAVVDLPAGERAGVLAAQESDAALRAEVLALCAASDDDHPEALSRARNLLLSDATAPQPEPGDVVGAWRIEAEIGHGGMGRVYRVARNDGAYEQIAALKFIKGLAGAAAAALFTRERQLLASLAHPSIARLLDGGTSASGQPYLVMEYIDGRPIDVWCRERGLDRDGVLDLFVRACAAVRHAHAQLVVHCDLKPSNILVRTDGQPMLLDFGIAQLADRIADDVPAAADGASAGYTPRYASPEQQRGERVGVASDVYSLGIVLAEMLDAAGVVRDTQLAAVIAMATQASPAARYASVEALCDDLAHLRAHRPLRAMPATLLYRLARFVRRQWLALLIVSGVLLLSAGFTWKVFAEGRRARAAEQSALAERDRALQAESEARASEATARETSQFLISVFQGANPDAGSGTVSIATLLDQALLRVERDLVDEPATRAQMSAALAEVLYVIGQPERGSDLYAQAIALERQQNRPLVLAEMLLDNAAAHLRALPVKLQDSDVQEALQLIERHAAADSLQRLRLTRAAAGIIAAGDPEAGAPLLETAAELARRIAPESDELADALGELGWNERMLGHHERAIRMLQDAAALRVRLHGTDHEARAGELAAIANTMGLARRYDEAEPLFLESIALRRRHGTLDNVDGAWNLAQYASLLRQAGRSRDALPLFDDIFAIAARKLPADHASLLTWRHNLATTLADAGDSERAIAIERETVDRVNVLWGTDHTGTATMRLALARMLGEQDCDRDAGELLDQVVAFHAARTATSKPDLHEAQIERARWLVSCRRHDEAQALLDVVAKHRAGLKPLVVLRLAQAEALLRLRRDGDDAAQQAVIAAEALARSTHAEGDPRAVLAQWPRLQWLTERGRSQEAATLATRMLADLEGKLLPDARIYARLRALRALR